MLAKCSSMWPSRARLTRGRARTGHSAAVASASLSSVDVTSRCAPTDRPLDALAILPFGYPVEKIGRARRTASRSAPWPTASATASPSSSYWRTSSARPSTDCGIVSPIALAVWRLTTRSNVVGCWMGKSAGLAPRRILSTYKARRRGTSRVLSRVWSGCEPRGARRWPRAVDCRRENASHPAGWRHPHQAPSLEGERLARAPPPSRVLG